MKILVVKRDKIGDMLLTTPMLRRLREALPAARIDVLASDYNAWVLVDSPDVDRVWVYRRTRTGGRFRPGAAFQQAMLAARLRFEGYDVAIAAQGEASPRATRRARLVGAKRTVAYVAPGEGRVSDGLAPPAAGHERDRMMALLAPLGVETSRAPDPVFRAPEDMLAKARGLLFTRGVEAGRYVVIGLGARRAKRQPQAAQVRRWAERLHRDHGLATVLLWTPGGRDSADYPGDDDAANEVLAGAPACIHPFRGPLWPAIGLVWLARTSIFPDSGLMHFAAASPGGVLGLFADPEHSPPPSQWSPLGARARWIAADDEVAGLDDDEVFAGLGLAGGG